MGKRNATFCDRCEKQAEDVDNSLPKRIIHFMKDYHGTQVDLCTECAKALKAWLEDPTSAPPGYKFKARPCPHLVPCADPNGCSGQELVPL